MSVWSKANEAREREGICAGLAVQAIQCGRDPSYYMRRAAEERARAYEFKATGEIVGPLHDIRVLEMMANRDVR